MNSTEEVMSASGAIKNIRRPLLPTIAHLCMFLGITKKTLSSYEEVEDYKDIVEYTKEAILGMKEVGLINGKGSTQGLIFDLKHNYGWSDKSQVEETGETTVRIVYDNE